MRVRTNPQQVRSPQSQLVNRTSLIVNSLYPVKIDSEDFRVQAGEPVPLKKWPTRLKPYYKSAGHYQKILGKHIEKLSALQNLLYAHDRYSVLLIFQAMDA